MSRAEPLASYLADCRDAASGDLRFPQHVRMILFSPTEAGLALLEAPWAQETAR